MREDGFYWTAYNDGNSVAVRELCGGCWDTCGSDISDHYGEFVILSDRLVSPGDAAWLAANYDQTPEAKPKSGMTDAERELLLAVGRWCGDMPDSDDLKVRGLVNAVEAEGK